VSERSGTLREDRRRRLGVSRGSRARKRRGGAAPTRPLRLQPLYPLPELVLASGLSLRTLLHFLRGAGIEPVRAGRFRYVPLAELEEKLGAFVESLRLVERHSDLEDLE
jgi:hypothetical protein